LEDGVLIKFDPVLTLSAPPGVYAWRLVQTDPTRFWQVFRDARTSTNRWIFNINLNGCVTNALIDQPADENLLDELFVEVPIFLGSCDDDQPVLNLKAESFPTVAAALLSYPDLQNWDWDA
jgi:hypothetical protein